jgi:hypothetical protein
MFVHAVDTLTPSESPVLWLVLFESWICGILNPPDGKLFATKIAKKSRNEPEKNLAAAKFFFRLPISYYEAFHGM